MLGMLLIVKSGKSLLGIYFVLWGVLGRSCHGRDHMDFILLFILFFNKQDQTLPKNKVKKYFGKQQTGSNIV
jgi:hypothetical protein